MIRLTTPASTSSSCSSSSSSVSPSTSSCPSSSLIPRSCICYSRSTYDSEAMRKYFSLFSHPGLLGILRHFHCIDRLSIKRTNGNHRIIPMRLLNELRRKNHTGILVNEFPVYHGGQLYFAPSVIMFTQRGWLNKDRPTPTNVVGYAVCRLPKAATEGCPLAILAYHEYVYSEIQRVPSPDDCESFFGVTTFIDSMDSWGGAIGGSVVGDWFLALMQKQTCFEIEQGGRWSDTFTVSLSSSIISDVPLAFSKRVVNLTLTPDEQPQLLALETVINALPTYDTPLHLCPPYEVNLYLLKKQIDTLGIFPSVIVTLLIDYLGTWSWRKPNPASYTFWGIVPSAPSYPEQRREA